MSLFFQPEQLSASTKYDIKFLKSGTALARKVIENWATFSPEQQTLMAGLLARPATDSIYTSPSGFFSIHYSLTGPDFIPSEDIDNNSIPDYAERIAWYCDSALEVYINHYGYLPPPEDNGRGGDDKYDIYLLALAGYGITFPDAPADSTWNDYSSFIGIHKDFLDFPPNDDPEGNIIGAQKVTCAHEFYHAVQLAYDVGEDLWLMEATATWMEEVIFPEVNDNYNYLFLFFDEPEVSLISNDGYHHYGTFIWPAFLQQKFGDTIFRPLWEACRFNNSLTALDSILYGFNESVTTIMPEFTLWNYMTSSRAMVGSYYDDAADYPEIRIDGSYNSLEHNAIAPTINPDGLASSYLKFTVGDERGILEVLLEGTGLISLGCSAVLDGLQKDTVLSKSAEPGTAVSLFIVNIEDYEKMAVIQTILTPGTVNKLFYLSILVHPYGDANGDGSVNIGDAGYLTNFIFHNGPNPTPIGESGDTNCDGYVNIADIVYLTRHIFHNGPAPCSSK
jgi:hypothetical protein